MLKKRLKSLNGFLLLRTLAIGILPISALTAEANYVLTLDIENQAIHVEVTVTNTSSRRNNPSYQGRAH